MPPRLIRCCLLYTLLGLATSLAVAWGLSVSHQLRQTDPMRREMGVAVVGSAIVRLEVHRWPGRLREQWELRDTVTAGAYRRNHRIIAQHIVEIGGEAFDKYEFDLLSSISVQLGREALPAPPPVTRIDERAARGAPVQIDNIAPMKTTIWRASAGWPLPALQHGGRRDVHGSDPRFPPVVTEHGAIDLPWPRKAAGVGGADPIYLPIQPRRGLLLNTIFYAALWAILLFTPGALRRHIRRARGRCPTCAYSLRGQPSPGCPECGSGRSATPPPAVD